MFRAWLAVVALLYAVSEGVGLLHCRVVGHFAGARYSAGKNAACKSCILEAIDPSCNSRNGARRNILFVLGCACQHIYVAKSIVGCI